MSPALAPPPLATVTVGLHNCRIFLPSLPIASSIRPPTVASSPPSVLLLSSTSRPFFLSSSTVGQLSAAIAQPLPLSPPTSPLLLSPATPKCRYGLPPSSPSTILATAHSSPSIGHRLPLFPAIAASSLPTDPALPFLLPPALPSLFLAGPYYSPAAATLIGPCYPLLLFPAASTAAKPSSAAALISSSSSLPDRAAILSRSHSRPPLQRPHLASSFVVVAATSSSVTPSFATEVPLSLLLPLLQQSSQNVDVIVALPATVIGHLCSSPPLLTIPLPPP
ncbi:hypothetical protein B296_00038317 [Ensete ventricosum]|uniref:Uncharacterized protein n=1 Tax=Ensete ventricosum TaxID=4639 RepID=A0A426YI10_ENSVE|nr:hypothetical protein B296_00038317 [Ensete ventricosum]